MPRNVLAFIGLFIALCTVIFVPISLKRWVLHKPTEDIQYRIDLSNEVDSHFQCTEPESTFPYDLGGTVCTCAGGWDRARYWRMVFAYEHDRGWMAAHFVDPVKFYVMFQNIPLTLLLPYIDESLEELQIMITGKWGWFGHDPISEVEPRYLSLIQDPFVSAPFGLAIGMLLVKFSKIPSLISYPINIYHIHWRHLGESDSLAQFVVVSIEYLLLSYIWALYKPPTKTFDFANYTLLILSLVYFTVVALLFFINVLLGVYKNQHVKQWRTLHIVWAASTWFLIFAAYVNPLPSMLTGILSSVVCIVVFAVLILFLADSKGTPEVPTAIVTAKSEHSVRMPFAWDIAQGRQH